MEKFWLEETLRCIWKVDYFTYEAVPGAATSLRQGSAERRMQFQLEVHEACLRYIRLRARDFRGTQHPTSTFRSDLAVLAYDLLRCGVVYDAGRHQVACSTVTCLLGHEGWERKDAPLAVDRFERAFQRLNLTDYPDVLTDKLQLFIGRFWHFTGQRNLKAFKEVEDFRMRNGDNPYNLVYYGGIESAAKEVD